jgi:signal transduction histidine kinase
MLGPVAAAVIGLVVIFWVAAILSLLDGPTGGWWLAVTYVVFSVAAPVPLLWCVYGFAAVQRARFRMLLGVTIPAPSGRNRVWRVVKMAAYHMWALVFGPIGGVLVLFFAAPVVARIDTRVAVALLGPGRNEALAQRVETLTRSRAQTVAAADAERRRIERDLHDGAQQRLVSLAMNLGMARATLAPDAPEPARQAIEAAHEEATQALAELREFVRGLHPAVLNDRGLDAALSGIAARAPLPVRLRVDVEPRCSPTIEAIAYFVVSETLTNVAKHAQAGRADVTVERTGDRLRIVVTDDGTGGADPGAGSGLRGLAQRAAAVDGTVTVHSPAGGPTTITAEMPCE